MAEIDLSILPTTRNAARQAGVAHYFTGVPCKYGHRSRRSVKSAHCLDCDKEASGKYHLQHRESAVAKMKVYHEENRGKITAQQRQHYAENRDLVNAVCREYYDGHREIILTQKRSYYELTADRQKEKSRAWQRVNPEKARVLKHARRARKRNAEGSYTAEDVAVIRSAQRDLCAMPDCRAKLKGVGHVDHIQALSRGGSNWPRNLQLLCEPCNLSKHARDPIEFAQSRGLLI